MSLVRAWSSQGRVSSFIYVPNLGTKNDKSMSLCYVAVGEQVNMN